MVTERNSSGLALAATDGEGAGDTPGMAAMPAPDSATLAMIARADPVDRPMFLALLRAFTTQKALAATLKAYVATLEARLAEIEAPGPKQRGLLN
jgi:hypothetical protein